MTKSSDTGKRKYRNAHSVNDGTIVVRDASNVRDRLEVPLSASLMGGIRTNKRMLESLIKGFGTSIESARSSGRASGFSVRVDPAGRPSITKLKIEVIEAARPSPSPGKAGDETLAGALTAARARGTAFVADLFNRPDMLSADDLANRLGVTRMTINVRRRQHELLGLEGAKRGYRFPEWQLDARGRAFPEISELFEIIGDDPWEVFRFLSQRHAALDDRVGHAALAGGHGNDVVAAARAYADGSFA